MPAERQDKARKVARPHYGPYRILNATPSNVDVLLVDKPSDLSLLVSLDRATQCYPELKNSWRVRWRNREKGSRGISGETKPGSDQGQVLLLGLHKLYCTNMNQDNSD